MWEPFPPGIWHDDGVYLLLGRALANGEGLRYVGVSGAPLAPKFPPVYPLTLAFVWRLFPNLPRDTAVFGLINVGVLIAGGTLFAAYLRRALRLPLTAAVGLAGLVWLSVDLWRVAMIPLSEPLFILLLIVSLWVATELERTPGWRQLLVFLAAFALLFHTRTIGVVVGAAVPLALLTRGHRREAVVAAIGAGGVVLPWMIWSSAATREIPESMRDILGSYGGWLTAQAAASPVGFVMGLPSAAWRLLDRLARVTIPLSTPSLRVAAVFVLVPALAFGLYRLARRSRATAFSVVLFLGVLWVWPYQDRRLLTPLIPFLWVVGALGAAPGLAALLGLFARGSEAVASPRGARRLLPLAGAAAVIWAAWFAVGSGIELSRGVHVQPYRIRAAMLARSVEALQGIAQEGIVVGAPELWPGINLHTGLTVAPSAPFDPVSAEGPSWGDPGQQFRLWQEAEIDYLILEQGGVVHGEALHELARLCPDGAVQYVAIWRGASLARLTWDEDCRRRARAWEASEP